MGRVRLIVADGTYHVMSRIAHREFFLNEKERGRLLEIAKRSAWFCGVELLAYTVLSNHFHLEVHVPMAMPLSEGAVLARYAVWKGHKAAADLASRWDRWRGQGLESAVQDDIRRLMARMHALPKFMQLLKEWYTMDYNMRTRHVGTLWERVFKSVLVESEQVTLSGIAGYIDLNSVRAGIVSDPSEYAWSSFGEACGAQSRGCGEIWNDPAMVRRRYMKMYGSASWKEAREKHVHTMLKLEEARSARETALRQRGWLTANQRWSIRALVDGVAVGSRRFIEMLHTDHPELFLRGKRATPPRRIAGDPLGLFAFRAARDVAPRKT